MQNNNSYINMSHGSGGKAMHKLIQNVFVQSFNNSELNKLDDQAKLDLNQLCLMGDQLAFTTDSYVVDPLFFPGGDIGKLAITGTVNDLAVGGAIPLYLTCSVIIEEGFSIDKLQTIVTSMKREADIAGIKIVTGDTKVVPRGAADKLFINTAGIGVIPQGIKLDANKIQPGDIVLINGYIGDHGAAIVDARGEMSLENSIETDCQTLNSLIQAMLEANSNIRCMRDATRGGIATVLNEFADASKSCIRINENALPLRNEVRGVCEILGLDPIYLANEGKVVAVVAPESAHQTLEVMRSHPNGKNSAIIGEVTAKPESIVILNTQFGGERVVDILVGEQLPRIC